MTNRAIYQMNSKYGKKEYMSYGGTHASAKNGNDAPKILIVVVALGATWLLSHLPSNFFHDPHEYAKADSAISSLQVPENYINEVGVALDRQDSYDKAVEYNAQKATPYSRAMGFIGFIKTNISTQIVENSDELKKNLEIANPKNMADFQNFANDVSSEISKTVPQFKEAQDGIKEYGEQLGEVISPR